MGAGMVGRRGLLLGAAVGVAGVAKAAGTQIAKEQVGYQDVPSGGQVCAACVYFEFAPAVGGVVNSRCKLVAGVISPSGWCEVFAPKG